MCGICGVYNAQSGEPVSPRLIERMTRQLAHRGPDETNTYLDNAIGLGFARLSIVDLAASHQPMPNETAAIWTVFNGEIWNYQTLRQELLAKGHRFRSNGDTEVIVHAYEEYGIDCVSHLHGMFSFAVWDTTQQRLLLARDKLGKKPLYYTHVDGDLLFASEIKALLIHQKIKRQVDMQSLADFLSFRYVPAPATLFAGIYKVQPGHFLLFERDTQRDVCYWDFRFDDHMAQPVSNYIAGIKQHVRRAVAERLMADVPLGAFLSGGVDSSIIVGTMSELTTTPVKTFSVGFDVPGYSELPYARLVADHFGTEHFELLVTGSDLLQYWPLLTWHRDEPVSEASDLAMYLLSRFARQQVKVALSGEGGDELFAGYPKYAFDWLARYYQILPARLRETTMMALFDHLPYGMRKLQLAGRALSAPAPQRWLNWFGIFNGPLKEQLLSAALKTQVDSNASRIFQACLAEHPQRDDLSSMLYLDTKYWLPDNLLMKADKMSMAASLETRLPLLDYQLVEYAASIPSSAKIKPFKTKYLFKQAFADMLLPPVLTRKKAGFIMPIGDWFRQGQRSFISHILLSERTLGRGLLNPTCVEMLVQDHLTGKTNYQLQLFILVSLELWFRVFIDAAQIEHPQLSMDDVMGEALSA